MKIRALWLLSATLSFNQCNHYGLLDKLENPGGDFKLYAFVTENGPTGMLSGTPSGTNCNGSGLPLADCACDSFAQNAGILHKQQAYRAWLSDSTNDMTCRLQGLSGNNCTLPSGNVTWYNTNNEIIATSYHDLMDGNLSAPIQYTQYRTLKLANVWTGTDPNGLRADAGSGASNCTGWTIGSTAQTGRVGYSGATGLNWSNAGNVTCENQNSIYCFAVP